ncbi:MAG: hypothetical protein PHD06_06255 [Bacteroidales bacterium]|nr:hypothetical protein [Bacteroidales bacterium]MDD4384763.1 hypothetical protein [Bacteroidales bacterium]MDY0198059.1 hypothetical protein [Tenuifilaceae bacterium]
MKQLSRVFLSLAIGLMLSNGCKTSSKITAWQMPENEYAFIEYYQTNEGKVIEGDPFPGRRIDGPTYAYSPETGEITSFASTSFNMDSLSIMLGKGLVLRGTQGGGMHSRLIPYTNVPFNEGKLEVMSIGLEGIRIQWDGQPILLKVGEPKFNSSSEIDTIPSPDGRVIVENTTTYTIVFHGFLKKEKLFSN